jgi:hypothetical protein
MQLPQYIGWIVTGLAATSFPSQFSPPRPAAAPTTEVRIRIRNTFGAERLQLHQPYTTLPGDVVKLTRYAYYISNLSLISKDGSRWPEPRSWHLLEVDEDGTSDFTFSLTGVPEDDYAAIGFAVGLDSLVNHGRDRAGVLNPDFGMFWEWESNYVFLKCEGYFQKPAHEQGAFVYHVARDGCFRVIRLPLSPGQLSVATGTRKTVEITADARKLFGGFPGAGLTLELNQPEALTNVMSGSNPSKLADNYARMFSVWKVANQ